MLRAALWGGLAGSAVFLGAAVGLSFDIEKKAIGFIMAFGTGILIGAASFELLTEAVEEGGIKLTTIAFIVGALLFTIFNLLIAKQGGHQRKRSKGNPVGHSGLAIFIGTIMDAIPESLIIGASLVDSTKVSYLLVIAVFLSNFPEGLSSSIGLKKDGYSKIKILALWIFVSLLALLSSLLGFILLKDSSAAIIAMISAFAAGGIVAMVSSTMMPEAYEEGGVWVGLIAALGLISSVILINLE
ncbi:ZIP family zinc transporter [Orenia metallireducens]|uniref:Zinc transporter, ZIP family n=1 Tax=Orenia metallireducens TaxID=1413210 RepID=A0A285IBP9_9FIRM|nr:ZIP family metal transporter [Orenia metallireducens]PRX28010.1 ZIP family zinc transporter [Orenia metallireducens]SNY45380.1 zinc transporter, ZIP family [Orenia metallireducens]